MQRNRREIFLLRYLNILTDRKCIKVLYLFPVDLEIHPDNIERWKPIDDVQLPNTYEDVVRKVSKQVVLGSLSIASEKSICSYLSKEDN